MGRVLPPGPAWDLSDAAAVEGADGNVTVDTAVVTRAIRKISRGLYQINPRYAARGTWHYNGRKKQGGVENLLAAFDSDGQELPADESIVQAAARSGEVEEGIQLIADMIEDINGGVDAPF